MLNEIEEEPIDSVSQETYQREQEEESRWERERYDNNED